MISYTNTVVPGVVPYSLVPACHSMYLVTPSDIWTLFTAVIGKTKWYLTPLLSGDYSKQPITCMGLYLFPYSHSAPAVMYESGDVLVIYGNLLSNGSKLVSNLSSQKLFHFITC